MRDRARPRGRHHRPASGAGTWWARVLVASKPARYRMAALAHADDHEDADGTRVLDWKQAQAAARLWAARQTGTGPLTVARACERYVEHLRSRKGERAAREVEGRARRHILPVLGAKRVADLTADEMRKWHAGMVRGDDDESRRRSRDSANRVLTILKAALNSAFRDGLVSDDRAWRRVGAFAGVGEARKVILGDPELQALIVACPPRPARARGRGSLDRRPARRADRRPGARPGRRRGHAARVRQDRPARDPPDPGGAGLVPRAGERQAPDAHLFTTAEGTAWTRSFHTRRFAAAAAAAGLTRRRPSTPCGTATSAALLKAGVPAKAVADHCGTSLAMIARHYSKFIAEDRKRCAALAAPAAR